MSKIALALAVAVLAASPISSLAKSKGGSHAVRGYVKKDGTYVAPHRSTNPDGSKTNNWSTKGNSNPYTGKEGTKPD